jgi:O-antigen/teichoic acid export membrane protein
MSLLKQFSKDTVIYGLGKGLKKFIGLLLLPVYTRALSPDEFGILDTLGAALFFITIFFNFGLDSAVSYFYFKPQDSKERGRILFTVFILRLLVIIPAVIISFFSTPLSFYLFHSYEYSTVILITCLLVPATMLMSEQEMIYRLHRNPWGYNFITIVKSFMNIAGGILLVVQFKFGVMGAQLASLISTVLVVLISLITFSRKQYFYEFSRDWAVKMFKFGFPLIWAGIAVWVYSLSDRFFLLHYKDFTEIGYYSIGSTFSQPIGLINMAVQMSFGVLFFEVYNREQGIMKPESKTLLTRALYLYLTVVSVFQVILSVFAYEIVGFITTPEYIPGIITIPVLTISLVISQMVEIVPVGISISEKTWHYTWITIVAAIVNAGLNFIFIPLWGFMGAAMTTLAATFAYFMLADLVSKRYFNAGFSRIKIYAFLASVLFLSMLFPYMNIHKAIFPGLLFKIPVIFFSWCLPFLFGFIRFEEIKEIAQQMKKKLLS